MAQPPNTKPGRETGLRHLLAAARYSRSGLRRLWRESAFRQEVLAGLLLFIVLALTGASVARLAGFAALFLIVVAVEALNTAVEVLVDHLSPDWSEFARDAKDLGSLAVGASLLAVGIYTLWALLG